jgi:hypothetical protein
MMDPQRRLWSSIILSILATPLVTLGLYHVLEASITELVPLSVISFVLCLGIVFVVLTFHDLLESSSSSPFKGLFILSAATLFLSIVAILESLQKTPALYFFLSTAVLFFLTTVKSRSLWLEYPTGFEGKKLSRELSRTNNAWIALYFCGLFAFLFLGIYYLGWILA